MARTSATLNAQELAAGTAAANVIVNARVPAWQRRMIPEGAIEELVAAVVNAVDEIRDQADPSQPGKATP
jgi:thioesterase domain-containing protein